MTAPFRYTRRVAFRDTDAAGIVHFSVFFNYMEEAEVEFWRSLGLSVLLHEDGRKLSWPRVHVECEYAEAARFDDLLEIEFRVERVGAKSVTFGLHFNRGGQPVGCGRMTAVCCEFVGSERPRSIPIPEPIAAALRSKLAPE